MPSEALLGILDGRLPALTREYEYYVGIRPKIVLADDAVPLYRQIVEQARAPIAQLTVDIAAERMAVEGFRVITSDSADLDVDSDSFAWDIWLASDADVNSSAAFVAMLLHGRAYALVEEAGTDLPLISFEHPAHAATVPGPGGRTTVAAIKRWVGPTSEVAVTWYEGRRIVEQRGPGGSWVVMSEDPAPDILMYEMRNRPDLLGPQGLSYGYNRDDCNPASDLDALYPSIDRLIQTQANRLTTELYAATKARWMTGVEPETDEKGQPTARTLRMSVDRLLMVENENAKLGSFDASPLSPFLEATRQDLSTISAVSRIPSQLLGSGDLVNLSNEALRSLFEALGARVIQRQVWAGRAINAAMRAALTLAGDERMADPRTRVEAVWRPPLPDDLAAMSAAATALVGAAILSPTAAQDLILHLSPSEREKAAQYAREDALERAANSVEGLLGPTPTPEQAAQQPTPQAAPVAG